MTSQFGDRPSEISPIKLADQAEQIAKDDLGSPGQRIANISVALFDQGAQSLNNLILSLVVATSVSAADFGRFSVVFVLFAVAWGSWRALIIEPFMTHDGRGTSRDVRAAWLPLISLSSKYAGAPLAGLLVLASLFTTGVMRESFLLFALIAPVIVALDATRALRVTSRDLAETLRIGTTWILTFLTLVVVGRLIWTGSASFDVLSLGVAAALATLAGARGLFSLKPRPLDWPVLRKQGLPLLAEFLIGGTTLHVLTILLAATVGVEQAAGFRGAIVLVGPIVTLIGGLRLGILADAVRYRGTNGDDRWPHYLLRTTAILMSLGLLLVIPLLVLPASMGEALLGSTWEFTTPVILPLAIAIVLTSIHLVTGTILRVRGLAYRALLTRIVQTPLMLGPSVSGALLRGAEGAAWGFLAGVAVASPLWIRSALSDTRRFA